MGRGDWGRIRAEIAWERIGEKEKMIIAVGCERTEDREIMVSVIESVAVRAEERNQRGGEKKAWLSEPSTGAGEVIAESNQREGEGSWESYTDARRVGRKRRGKSW